MIRCSKLLVCLGLIVFSIATKAVADGPWTASTGYSSVQGTNQWYYQERPTGGGTVVNMLYNWTGLNIGYDSYNGVVSDGWIGNYQGVADSHPGSAHDTLRKWAAPSAGTVSITGRVYKMDTAGGQGLNVSVEKNGTSIWSRSLAYNDSTGYTTDASLGAVSVNSGDSIAFVFSKIGTFANEQTAWDPTITKLASYTASAGYSSVQGTNQWYYQERPTGGGTVVNMLYNWTGLNIGYDSYNGVASDGWIGNYQGVADSHPGSAHDTLRKWAAPSAGTVSVTGRVYKMDTGGGQGLNVSVEKNGTSIWSRSLAYNDSTGYTTDASLGSVSVNSGDSIAFVFSKIGTFSNEQTAWDPTISYGAGATTLWNLNTSDTQLGLGISGNRPAITQLKDASTSWNWVPSSLNLPILNTITVSSTQYTPNWSYTTAAVDTSSGTKVTLTFTSTSPSLTLTQIWWAHSGAGPVEQTTVLTNNAGATATINDSDVLATDLTVTSDNTVTLWRFNRSEVRDDANDSNFTTGVLKTAMGATTSVATTIGNIDSPGNYQLPFAMLDVGGVHGLYLGYECDFGLLNTTTSGNADLIRNTFTLMNSGSFTVASGASIALPGMFYGTYAGNTDAGSNHMKKWFWTNKMTPTLVSSTNEPLVEMCLNTDSAAATTSFFAAASSLASWGVELGKEDFAWTNDANTDPPFGWDWSPNTTSWPNGINLASTVHAQGLKLSLYMGNQYNHVDLATAGGVSSEQQALETRFNGTATNFVGPAFDYWRSDEQLENTNDYSSHLGFVAVLDYMISNHSGFRWENCSGGGSKKSFDLLQRQTFMTTEDSGLGLTSPDNYRMAYYANSYMINPVQLKSDNLNFTPNTDTFYKYQFRIGFLGAWLSAPNGTVFYQVPEYQTHVALYKTHQRPILRGADVYHILPICNSSNWDGIELFNSAINKGSVVLFKPNAGVGNSPTIVLQGLISTNTYSLKFQDRSGLNSSYTSVSGSTLMSTGISPISGTTGDYDSEIIWINY